MFRNRRQGPRDTTLVVKIYSSDNPYDDDPETLVGEVRADFYSSHVETTKQSGPPAVIQLALGALSKVVRTARHTGARRGWNAAFANGTPGGGGGGVLSALFTGAFMGLVLGRTSEIADNTAEHGGMNEMADRMDRHGVVDEGCGHLPGGHHDDTHEL